MQGNLSHFAHTRSNSVSLGNNHGYRFEGDTAILNAELALSPVAADSDDNADNVRQHWALQLWACENPHQGGPLRGLKVAEAELALPALANDGQHEATRLETAAFAQLPPSHGEYAMVMVLASGDRGRYDQVHDFSNYAVRQQFSGPSLEGNVGYRFDGDSVVLQAEAVRNARAADNLSGTLGLQLWALREPYQGGQVHGTLLAQASLGRLLGQDELLAIEERAPLAELAPGAWQLALLLSEWTDAAGFITRDYCNFSAPHRVEAEARAEDHVAFEPERFDAIAEEPAEHESIEHESIADESIAHEAIAHEAIAREPIAPEAVAETQARAVPVPAPKPVVEAQTPALAPPAAVPVVEVEPTVEVPRAVAEPLAASPTAPASEPKIALKALTAARAEKAPSAKPLATQAPRVEKAREAATEPAAASPKAASAAVPGTARLSVQTASVDELAAVPGLNKKLAQAIVKARPFNSLEDVVRVRGIGDKLLQKLRDKLAL